MGEHLGILLNVVSFHPVIVIAAIRQETEVIPNSVYSFLKSPASPSLPSPPNSNYDPFKHHLLPSLPKHISFATPSESPSLAAAGDLAASLAFRTM